MVFRSVWKDDMDSNMFVDSYRYFLILNMGFREDDIYLVKVIFLCCFIYIKLYIRILLWIEALIFLLHFKYIISLLNTLLGRTIFIVRIRYKPFSGRIYIVILYA